LGCRGIKAAGYGIFNHTAVVVSKKSAKLKSVWTPRRVWANDADIYAGRIIAERIEREHRFRRFEQNGDPTGTIISPLRIGYLGTRDAKKRRNFLNLRFIDSPAANERRRSKCKASIIATNWNQTGATLLNDVRALRLAAGSEPGVATAKCRMARKWQFPLQRKNTDTIIGVLNRWRQEECRLRKIEPLRDSLHFLRREAIRIQNHGQGISRKRLIMKHIDELKTAIQGAHSFHF
jgi:hypothetical protein